MPQLKIIRDLHEDIIAYLQFLDGSPRSVRFDSRLIWNYKAVRQSTQADGSLNFSAVSTTLKPHEEWMKFFHEFEEDFRRLGSLDLRHGKNAEEFAMLTMDQASVLVLFSQLENPISCAFLWEAIQSLRIIYPSYGFPGISVKWVFVLQFALNDNKTLEEKEAEKEAKSIKPEKKIEIDLGKQLEEQGEEVHYQVPCANGIADIVTADAIYEIKAHLSRSNLHRAIGQVLGYRACINPAARVVVVGKKHKKEPVDFDFARSVGVEVIVWEDRPQQIKVVNSREEE